MDDIFFIIMFWISIGIVFIGLIIAWELYKNNGNKFYKAATGCLLVSLGIGIRLFIARSLIVLIPYSIVLGGLFFIGLDVYEIHRRKYDKVKIIFYNECLNCGIAKCQTEKEKQKATLIAQKNGIKFKNICILFEESEALSEGDRQASVKKSLNSQKELESKKYADIARYTGLKGREKQITMLSDDLKIARDKATDMYNGAMSFMNSTQVKENDWAVQGGIANGIAGPAAGIAVAMDAQLRNQQIREQNYANQQAMKPFTDACLGIVSRHDDEAKWIEKEIEKSKIKLVSEECPEKWMNYLTFSNTSVSVSKTGTCTVTTTVNPTKEVIIFDDTKAAIDGFINAEIYDGTQCIGIAPMLIPVYGITGETKLLGYSLFSGTTGKKYSVKFKPGNLWAI